MKKELEKIEQQSMEKNFKVIEILEKTKNGTLKFGKEYSFDEWHNKTK